MTSTSWYRKSLWYFKGTKEYTRTGFERATHWFNSTDLDVDAADKHVLVTGASTGVGLSIALQIAKRGAFLHLLCAKKNSLDDARKRIIRETGNDKIELHPVNMSNPRSVTLWASKFTASHTTCDVIIHAFDYVTPERLVDDDGIEGHFAANTLAAHIITVTLSPLLNKSSDPRVITVANSLMLNVKLDPYDLAFEKMTPFDGTLAYAQTKRQQISLNLLYATRFNNIKFYSMHPGWTNTPSFQDTMPELAEGVKDNLRTPDEGADTAIWLALSKAATKYPSGLFFQDRYPANTHLPLAWTRSSIKEEVLLLDKLDDLVVNYSITQAYPISRDRSSSIKDKTLLETFSTEPSEDEIKYKNYSAYLEDSELMWRLDPTEPTLLQDKVSCSPILREDMDTAKIDRDLPATENSQIVTISELHNSYDSKSEEEIFQRNNNTYEDNAFKDVEILSTSDFNLDNGELPIRNKVLDFESVVLED